MGQLGHGQGRCHYGKVGQILLNVGTSSPYRINPQLFQKPCFGFVGDALHIGLTM